MSARTLAELLYLIASLVVTLVVTWYAAWGYPQGATAIWTVGLVGSAFVFGMGLKPFLDALRADRAATIGSDHA